MEQEIKEKLNAQISSVLDTLKTMTLGSDEYRSTVDDLSKLIDKQNEIDKIDLEIRKQDTNEESELSKDIKERNLDAINKKDQLFKNVLSVCSIFVPVVVTIWGTYKTFEFEKNGTVTTIMGRGFINKLIPKK